MKYGQATEKQKPFIREYVSRGDALESARAAGYSDRSLPSLRAEASRLKRRHASQIADELRLNIVNSAPSDWFQWNRYFAEGRSRLTFCPSGYETENGSLELLEVVNRLIHKWTLRYHAPFSLNLAGIGFGLTSPIIKSLSGKDCSTVYPK